MIRTFALLLSAAASAAAQTPCDQWKSFKLADVTITTAENIAAGEYRPRGAPAAQAKGPGAAPLQVPAFCRIAATLTPTSDSHIDIEVWLPENWNGKYQAVG